MLEKKKQNKKTNRLVQDQILSPDVNTEVTTLWFLEAHIRILTGNLSTTQFTRSCIVAPSEYSGL